MRIGSEASLSLFATGLQIRLMWKTVLRKI